MKELLFCKLLKLVEGGSYFEDLKCILFSLFFFSNSRPNGYSNSLFIKILSR